MLKCAEALLDKVPEENRAKEIDFMRYLAPQTEAKEQSKLVISAFTLSELPSDSVRKTTVENLWSQTSDTLVLIDRGTPDSARMIADARAQLLELGGVHTFAPLPHDQPDPTTNAQAWLHFSQRAQRPTFTMRIKRAKSNIEDLKYSYVVVRRGPRPVAEPVEEQEAVSLEVAQQSPGKYLPNGLTRKTPERLSVESYTWPRVLLPPLKRKGHVIVDVCTFQGNVERWTFTKSHDKQAYRDARKANWGDLFPHEPKSAVVRPGFMPLPDKDDVVPEQKKGRVYRVSSALEESE
ncbi:37S ribosomal protein S22 [Linderina pennispora]|nr:37S ribosomal protein S22 [Linderina pennispora]